MSRRQVKVPRVAGTMRPMACVWLGAAVICSYGCGSKPQREIFAVEGRLMVNGQPADNASIAFHLLGGGREAFCPVGRTDADGKFRLTTHARFDGAPPGDYAVTVIWLEESSVIDECSCTDMLKHDRLKGVYSDADKTEFRVTVGRSANCFCFDAWRERGVGELP